MLPFLYFLLLLVKNVASLYPPNESRSIKTAVFIDFAKSPNVRGRGTFFDACLDLGHFFRTQI
jgi:hypothetical protein